MDKKWDLKRTLTVCLGGFWLADGILQLQPAMFTNAFVSTVLAPNLQNQPFIIEALVAFGIRLFSTNIFWWNLASALGTFGSQGTTIGNIIAVDLLMLLGFFLIFIANRFVAWIIIVFLLIVWWIGQSFGGIQTFPFGAATDPNSAPLLILFLLPIFFTAKDKLHT